MVVSHDQLQVRTRKGKKEPEDRQQEIWERAERVYPVRLSLWEKLQFWQILKVLESFSIFFYQNNSDYLQKARKYGHFTGYKN